MQAQQKQNNDWHLLHTGEVCARLRVDPDHGLALQEADARLKKFGPNQIQEKAQRSVWRMLFEQFADFMIIVLLAAAVVSGLLGELADTVVIIVIVILNAIIGVVQEYRAERAVAALKKMSACEVRVRRGKQVSTVIADDLVPGDIVLIEAGNIIPADLRLIQVADLKIDEAVITGESVTVNKTAAPLENREIPPGDRINLAYKGTIVTHGRAVAVVYATGMATELGKIAALLESNEILKTPLQKRLTAFGRRLAIIILGICLFIFLIGLMRGESVTTMFLTAISLAVAAIPEALPAVVTVSLALGAREMVLHNALIRRLPAVETLGSVTIICSDKTGTLTKNSMKAEIFSADGRLVKRLPDAEPSSNDPWQQLGKALSVSNDAEMDAHGDICGDPTETAFYAVAQSSGFEKSVLLKTVTRIAELPFDAERKRMTTIHSNGSVLISYTKGAPEQVLPRCSRSLVSEGSVPINHARLLAHAEMLAAKGFRVLAFAYREWSTLPPELTPDTVEQQLTLIGMVGLIDPPRPEARHAIEHCQNAGIKPIMITGDHPATAKAIANRLGIAGDTQRVMTGQELAQFENEELLADIAEIPVFARVSPEQKILIVRALQRQGAFVAMTGDGVNDAPALKQADIGVAMGKKGTDVAREAADMVLMDDNFATIVRAVREGRRIYDNIRKFIKYIMTGNSGEIWTLFLAPFLNLPIPLLPIHILWINLITDGLPGLALAIEPEERGIMNRPPRPPHESVFVQGMWQHILWIGLLIGGLSLTAQAWAFYSGSEHGQTMVFMVLSLSQLVHAMAIRSERHSLFSIGIFSNILMLAAIVFTFLLQLAIVYTPLLNTIFKTAPLDERELLLCLLLPLLVLLAVEVEKFFARRGWIYKNSAGRPIQAPALLANRAKNPAGAWSDS